MSELFSGLPDSSEFVGSDYDFVSASSPHEPFINGIETIKLLVNPSDDASFYRQVISYMHSTDTSERAELRRAAETDELTGMMKREPFYRGLETAVSHADRRGDSSPSSVLLIDLDYFKAVNDSHGHAVGDTVLQEAATRLVRSVRSTDLTCRYGGEEFAGALVGTPPEDSIAAIENIRRQLAEPSSTWPYPINASIGIAPLPVGATLQQIEASLKAADDAMYVAKRNGRNNAVIHGTTTLLF